MELGSMSGGALAPDPPTVHIDDLTSNRQSDTGARARPGTIAGATSRPLISEKQSVVKIGGHAGTLVFHSDFHLVCTRAAGHDNLAAAGRILRGVAQQNRQNVCSLVPVA